MPAGILPIPYEHLYIYLISGIVREEDEPVLGNDFIGNWLEGETSFLFFSRPSSQMVQALLSRRPQLQLEDEFHFTYEAWQGGDLAPVRLDPFWIVPPWLETTPPEGLIPILLDPGVVFGNCRHPTTRTCLEALSLAAQHRPFRRVLDLGTGTGILALAAARLGADSVVAVDLNPLCVKTARRNVALNGLSEVIRVIEARGEDVLDNRLDLIVANIHYEVIIRILEARPINREITLILSGLMRSQHRDVLVRLNRVGFQSVREWDHDMTWYTVLTAHRTHAWVRP